MSARLRAGTLSPTSPGTTISTPRSYTVLTEIWRGSSPSTSPTATPTDPAVIMDTAVTTGMTERLLMPDYEGASDDDEVSPKGFNEPTSYEEEDDDEEPE